MNYAKPVVSVDNTAISEVVDHGSTGILVPTGDSGALADAVLRLKQDAGLRAEMAAAGRQKAASMFRWDHIAPMYASVLAAADNSRFGR
jgi:glycosyltransferase involved in cell wall biosynthesis